MKAILLAGGTGTRMYPLTQYINKHLLPIGGLPMIYYPLSFLILLGVTEVLIVVNPSDKPVFEKLLGNGTQYGIKFRYIIQNGANGLAEPLILSEEFIDKNERFIMMLGDNLFYAPAMANVFKDFTLGKGANLVLTSVQDPRAFGVVEYHHETKKIISIEEKPENPKSNLIATGLYCYDYTAIEFAKHISRSSRGELEITDVNKEYLRQNNLNALLLDRSAIWFDCGTHKMMEIASDFVYTIEKNHNISKLGVIEECALRTNLITIQDFEKIIVSLKSSDYKEYLCKVLKEYEKVV